MELCVVSTSKQAVGSRVARHRRRQALSGARRVEATVPAQDVELIRRLATALRTGGERAERLRAAINAQWGYQPAQSGDELLAFFRSSPLVDDDLSFERDRSSGRPIEL
jgi:hypothetical protein